MEGSVSWVIFIEVGEVMKPKAGSARGGRFSGGRARSLAQGTLANIGIVIHEADGSTLANLAVPRQRQLDRSVWERRFARLQERLERIRTESSLPVQDSPGNPGEGETVREASAPREFQVAVNRPLPEWGVVTRSVSADTPPPVCVCCCGPVLLESHWSWSSQVEKRANRWQCADADCPGRRILIVQVFPTSAYERRG